MFARSVRQAASRRHPVIFLLALVWLAVTTLPFLFVVVTSLKS